MFAVRHHEVSKALFDDAGFDFAFDHGAQVAVFSGNGHHERGFDFALEGLHAVKIFEERRAVEPWADGLGNAVLYTEIGLRRYGHHVNIWTSVSIVAQKERMLDMSYTSFGVVSHALKKRCQLCSALIVAILAPFHGRVIHFIYHDD